MRSVVENIVPRIKPEIANILRTVTYYTTAARLVQFGIHIWAIMAIHWANSPHVVTSVLNELDRRQHNLLDKMGCDATIAFTLHNFEPPTLRRNIAVLDLIHKRVLGLAHQDFDALLSWDTNVSPYVANI